MKRITVGSFAKNCLAVLDGVQANRRPIVITKLGKPVAKLVPLDAEVDEIYGFLAGKGVIVGDIVSPCIFNDSEVPSGG
jgi:prevent-host-death family protein